MSESPLVTFIIFVMFATIALVAHFKQCDNEYESGKNFGKHLALKELSSQEGAVVYGCGTCRVNWYVPSTYDLTKINYCMNCGTKLGKVARTDG